MKLVTGVNLFVNAVPMVIFGGVLIAVHAESGNSQVTGSGLQVTFQHENPKGLLSRVST